MTKKLTSLKALKAIGKLKENDCYINTTVEYKIVENTLKGFEIIKENLIFSLDEGESDKPCLIIGVKVDKNHIVVIYQTFDKEKIDLLKEVLQ